ncbi:MAG: PQQ-like beta-propeller repeat protein [Planctomycetaceae bacterium]|nr:PQQ-like beta-propeller repeat protein [Planctomycetaceae bacterium]
MHRILFAALAVSSLAVSATAGDWPQILGPTRNGIAVDEKLADKWPADGPKTVWQRKVGTGFSGIVVSDGIAVLFHRVGNNETAEAMNAATGKRLWKTEFPTDYIPSYTSDDGPRATPLIHKGRVYLYGVKGGLYCVDLKSGRKLWQRDTYEDYSSKKATRGEPATGYFGIGTTPIVEGNKLIVNIGGNTKEAGIVAFSLENGRTVWKSTTERASYSSPTSATIDGTRHVIFAARLNVVSIDPANGKTRFRIPFGMPGPNVTAAVPLVLGNRLFVSASYNFGALYAALSKNDGKTLWSSDEIMSSQYTTCIPDGNVLYGIHGRFDQGASDLRCFNPATKKIAWEKTGFGYATLIEADGKLIALKADGELVLIETTSKQYRELARANVLDKTTRAIPAIANGRLYVRDSDTLKCLNLGRTR